jgi:2-oxo-4-hydroxy-4-carboxy-5-ureidoimidazoline decarboxylase
MVEPRSDIAAHVWLDSLTTEAAREALTRCCGSRRWVAAMLDRRPFGSASALAADARAAWSALGRNDLLEAFSHHPRIGANLAEQDTKFEATRGWSQGEQSGVAGADERTMLELQAANQAYLERFGFIFIICASGKSAQGMLAALEGRLANHPDVELSIAAAEQAKITEIRLEKLSR